MARQAGFALMELVVAVILATLLAVWGASAVMNRITDAQAESAAVWMLSMRQALHAYIDRYAHSLRHATSATALLQQGYADWTAPTVAELKADGLLSAGFPERAYFAGATLRLWHRGGCPGSDCRIDGLVHGNNPIERRSGGVDEQMVAQWVLASKGHGGAVASARPGQIRGPAFGYPNPPWSGAALPPGTLAMAITHEQWAQGDFLRVGDSRDPDFKGDATITGNVRALSDLSIVRYLRLESQETKFLACAQEGDIAGEANGGLLICRNQQWRSAASAGGGFSFNEFRGCFDHAGKTTSNPVTQACSCPVGTAVVQISDSGHAPFPEGRTVGYLCVG